MTTLQPAPRGAIPLWLKLLLAGSLTLNLMVVGLVVGAKVGDRHGADRHAVRADRTTFDPALGPFARALPDEYRDRATTALAERAGDLRANRIALAAQIETMISALRADPYDPNILRDTLVMQSKMFQDRADSAQTVLLDQINSMNAEEREALANRLEKGFRRAMDRARP